MDLNDAFYFVHVVEKQGFTAAGRALGIPKSRISRHVQQLEEKLGARLLQRTSRRMVVTEAGQDFYRHARKALDCIANAKVAVQRKVNLLEGRVTVSCSVGMAQFGLNRILPQFLLNNPRVDVIQQVSNKMVDLLSDGADVAIRGHVAQLPDSSLIQTRLARVPWHLFCAPEYLDRTGAPTEPTAFTGSPGLCLGQPGRAPRWIVTDVAGGTVTIPYQVRFASDDMTTLKQAAANGLGLVALPSYVCAGDVDAGTLVKALPDWSAGQPQISLLMPSRQGVPPAVEAFIAHLRRDLPSVIEA